MMAIYHVRDVAPKAFLASAYEYTSHVFGALMQVSARGALGSVANGEEDVHDENGDRRDACEEKEFHLSAHNEYSSLF